MQDRGAAVQEYRREGDRALRIAEKGTPPKEILPGGVFAWLPGEDPCDCRRRCGGELSAFV